MSKLPFEKVEREIIIKKPAETDDKYGTYPDKRSTEELINFGIVNIDKPQGPTSHQVSEYVQRILKIKKSGHSGTLDPNVTGILPVALKKATRVVQILLPAGKEYICLMHLHKPVEKKQLLKVLKEFTGKIKQLPPIKSAVKRQERYRSVYYLEIIEIDKKNQDVLFRVGCQAGTYIRKLTHDIGQKLETGAHMAELRRTKAGPFNESTAVTLQDLADAFAYYKNDNIEKPIRKFIQPIENALEHIPKIWVFDTTVDSLAHGADLSIPGIAKLESGIEPDQKIAILTLKGELVGFGESLLTSKKIKDQDKGKAVKIKKVFMDPGVYPKFNLKKE
ncbi:RNA-guided pseudouridylation complex pseudouridine synthase subunit Cbf5 [Nanoarchaeota archaeon]